MPLDRREVLVAAGAVAAASVLPRAAYAAAPFQQPPLPYAEDALAPTISARTVGLHYGKHHKAYFEALNPLVASTPYAEMTLEDVVRESHAKGDKAIFNQAGQAWNHNWYWAQFAGGPAAPEGAFLKAIDEQYGGIKGLVDKMVVESGKVFGTGWVWLAQDGGRILILGLQDAGNPIAQGMRPLAGIDVWEHAYYLDYENRRPEHVRKVLDGLVNWKWVGQQMSS